MTIFCLVYEITLKAHIRKGFRGISSGGKSQKKGPKGDESGSVCPGLLHVHIRPDQGVS